MHPKDVISKLRAESGRLSSLLWVIGLLCDYCRKLQKARIKLSGEHKPISLADINETGRSLDALAGIDYKQDIHV